MTYLDAVHYEDWSCLPEGPVASVPPWLSVSLNHCCLETGSVSSVGIYEHFSFFKGLILVYELYRIEYKCSAVMLEIGMHSPLEKEEG